MATLYPGVLDQRDRTPDNRLMLGKDAKMDLIRSVPLFEDCSRKELREIAAAADEAGRLRRQIAQPVLRSSHGDYASNQ